ncbi:MAG: hypothetical protein K2H43_04630, partial [Clostridia bacterium]|nr:hypothetical protein [Clostridia bacterium]
TKPSTDALADGAKGYWYAFEGKMDREGGVNCSNPSIRTLSDEPIGYSVWNKAEGRWESQGLTIKLRFDYSFPNFVDFAAGETSKIFVTVTGEQNGETLKKEYLWDYGQRYELGTDHLLGICYGVAFTPNAPLSTEQAAGFYKNAEIPDLYNGGSWKGVKQVSCTGFGVDGEEGNRDMSFIGGSGAKFRAVWGKDVCSYTKNMFDGTTVLDFQY